MPPDPLAVLCTTFLVVFALACLTVYFALRLLPRSRASAPTTPRDEDQLSQRKSRAQAEEDGKRWEKKRERYSVATGRWEADEEEESESGLDSEEDDGDSDDEGGTKRRRDRRKKRRMLFTVRERVWPKSAEYAGFEDYIAISLHSSRLTSLLRTVRGLKECEAVFDDEPEVDVKDLFLVLDELRPLAETPADAEETPANVEEAEEQVEEKAERKGKEEGGAEKAKEEVEGDGQLKLEEREKTEEEKGEEREQMQVLLGYLEETFKPIQAKLTRLLHPTTPTFTSPSPASASTSTSHHPHAQISFDLLWAVYRPGTLAVATHALSGEKYAFRVKGGCYDMSRDGMAYNISGQSLVWTGEKYTREWVSEKIMKYKSLRRLSTLPLTPLEPGSKLHDELTARGRQYCSLTGDAQAENGSGLRYLKYGGTLMQLVGGGMDQRVVKLRAEGRAVVDVKSYKRMNPGRASRRWDNESEDDYFFDHLSHPTPSSEPLDPLALPASELALLPPTVPGFSLALREWGELSVCPFSPISFRENAWDQLVLDERTKSLVKGLVENNEAVRRARRRGRKDANGGEGGKEVVSDIIEGKGGGLVIALHGLPGVGKTLTAEAVAESLQVPLYTVGAGSLGVQADVLETRLRDVLDVAQIWGAVLLIDEADVFLEARSMADVARNAMVSVFLRMLEHHSGVLFLTTNRVRSIDEAFLSRFSLAITYPNLDAPKRKIIWRQFLSLAGVGISPSSPSSSSSCSTTATGLPNGVVTSSKDSEEQRHESFVSEKYLDELSRLPGFNGRQIKNIVRTAQSLALSQSAPLGKAQIDVVVKANQDFQRDFEEADERGVYEVKGEGWRDKTSLFN
ncbi:hypothetical protein JCM10213_004260 [Rhodosporidiobolus nylandii]